MEKSYIDEQQRRMINVTKISISINKELKKEIEEAGLWNIIKNIHIPYCFEELALRWFFYMEKGYTNEQRIAIGKIMKDILGLEDNYKPTKMSYKDENGYVFFSTYKLEDIQADIEFVFMP